VRPPAATTLKRIPRQKLGPPVGPGAVAIHMQIRCWQAGLSPPDRRITRIHWVERCSPGTIRGVRPLQLKSLTNPTTGLSTGGGLRKPHASNSAGAASNGARVVVSTGESPRQRPSFGKGDCNSRPTTPFPTPARAGIGRRGHAVHGGCRLERLKPCLALKSIPCSDARAGAAREGCTRVWTDTSEGYRKGPGRPESDWTVVAPRVASKRCSS
jgi:hypothetical protein